MMHPHKHLFHNGFVTSFCCNLFTLLITSNILCQTKSVTGLGISKIYCRDKNFPQMKFLLLMARLQNRRPLCLFYPPCPHISYDIHVEQTTCALDDDDSVQQETFVEKGFSHRFQSTSEPSWPNVVRALCTISVHGRRASQVTFTWRLAQGWSKGTVRCRERPTEGRARYK